MGDDIWVGLVGEPGDALSWGWIAKTTPRPEPDTANWLPGEPAAAGRCGVLVARSAYRWDNLDCELLRRAWLCEVPDADEDGKPDTLPHIRPTLTLPTSIVVVARDTLVNATPQNLTILSGINAAVDRALFNPTVTTEIHVTGAYHANGSTVADLVASVEGGSGSSEPPTKNCTVFSHATPHPLSLNASCPTTNVAHDEATVRLCTAILA